MGLMNRIANYFKEWDGVDETAPKMELNIDDLRYIASMNAERCSLRRDINETKKRIEHVREHNYENCHNLTCRKKCEHDGYNQCVQDFKNLINELVETLEEMRDANGSCSQEETCRFILNYMKQIGLLKE